jgi:hypothetical protein
MCACVYVCMYGRKAVDRAGGQTASRRVSSAVPRCRVSSAVPRCRVSSAVPRYVVKQRMCVRGYVCMYM